MKKVYPILVIVLIFGIFTLGWQIVGQELALNPNTNLNNESIVYIATYSGYREARFDENELDTSSQVVTEPENVSGKSTVDFAQEYLESKTEGKKITGYVKTIVNMPEFFVGAFNLNVAQWSPYLIILGTFLSLATFIAIYLLIRGQA